MTDYFGKPAELGGKRLWLFDMDGTIYNENTLFPGTLPLLRRIAERGGHSVFITNNSSRSVEDYIAKLRGMGIETDREHFFTSSQATVLLLQSEYPGALVYCQGTRSLVRELREAGIRVTEQVEPVDVVLLGFDNELTSGKLRRTCEILTLQSPVYLATNPDLVCPVSFGYVPDCGSISIMLKNATGKYPRFIGKPEPTMVELAMQAFGCTRDETILLGDRLYTDIAAGLRAGVSSVCLLSGEATVQDILQAERKPSFTFRDVGEICALL